MKSKTAKYEMEKCENRLKVTCKFNFQLMHYTMKLAMRLPICNNTEAILE